MNSKKLRNTILVLTVFSLWLSVKMNATYERYLGFFLILTFGILHGANDIKIMLSQPVFKTEKKISWVTHLVLYVVLVAFFAVLFYQYLWLSLIVFLISSAYHFGEQHWNYWLSSKIRYGYVLYLSYGFMIFFMLFHIHNEEVVDIVLNITGVKLSSSIFSALLAFSTSMFLLGFVVLTFKNKTLLNWPIILREIFYFAVIYAVFKMSVLVWAFSIYFIFWHTIPSLFDQINYLYKKQNYSSYYSYFKHSFIYWMSAILSLLAVFYFFYEKPQLLISLLFSFLAALTFPHVWVMKRMFKKNIFK